MSTPGRSYPKRSRQSTGTATYAPSRRARRAGTGRASTGGGSGVVVDTDTLGVAAQKWTKVLRAPMAPTDEPYFGSSASASFQIPMWVKVDELTAEERAKYDEEDKQREEQRAIWRRELAARAAEEEAAKAKEPKDESKEEGGDEEEDDGNTADDATNSTAAGEGDMNVEPANGGDETMVTPAGAAPPNETKAESTEDGGAVEETETPDDPREQAQVAEQTEAPKEEASGEAQATIEVAEQTEALKNEGSGEAEAKMEVAEQATAPQDEASGEAEATIDEAADARAASELASTANAIPSSISPMDGQEERGSSEVLEAMDVNVPAEDGGQEAHPEQQDVRGEGEEPNREVAGTEPPSSIADAAAAARGAPPTTESVENGTESNLDG